MDADERRPMTTAQPGTIALGAVAALLLLTACGETGQADPEFLAQSPRAITKTAFAEMADLTSVRILGSVATGEGLVRVDLTSDNEGNCAGSFMLPVGGTQFIHTDETTWLKPDQDYWNAVAATPQLARKIVAELRPGGATQVESAWTLAPAGTVDVDHLCTAASLIDDVKARKDGGEGRLSKGDVELIGETEAIAVNEKGGGRSSTVWVSVTSPHRVVKVVKRGKGVVETVSFEEFGVDVNADAPAEDDVVDVSAYLQGAPENKGARKR